MGSKGGCSPPLPLGPWIGSVESELTGLGKGSGRTDSLPKRNCSKINQNLKVDLLVGSGECGECHTPGVRHLVLPLRHIAEKGRVHPVMS